jgi:hypothetical protein
MEPIFDQQIGIFKNVLPDDWCDDIISIYQTNSNQAIKRGDFETVKGDEKKDSFLSGFDYVPQHYISFFQDLFINQLLLSYEKEYPTFSQLSSQNLELVDFLYKRTSKWVIQ